MCASVLIGCGCLLCTSEAGAQMVGATVSLAASHGSYGTADSDGVYVFTGVDAAAGPVRVAFTLPLTHTTTRPIVALPGTDVSSSSSMTGAGDPLLRGDIRVVNDTRRGLQVSLAGAFKYGMVDASSGRGSGEHDVGGGASAFLFSGRTSLMADAMYWHYGDPEGLDYVDGVSYSVGAGRMIGTGRWSVLGTLAGFSAGLDGGPPPVSVGVSLLAAFLNGHSVAVSSSIGLNSGASDYSFGVSWRVASVLRGRSSAAAAGR